LEEQHDMLVTPAQCNRKEN